MDNGVNMTENLISGEIILFNSPEKLCEVFDKEENLWYNSFIIENVRFI